MKNQMYGIIILCVIALSGCGHSLPKPSSETPEVKKPEPTITERLSGVMTDLQQSEKIYLDKTTSNGTKYLLLDKDELTSGMDWLGYALIEGISDNGSYSFVTNYFVRSGKQPGLSIRLVNEPPVFNWSFEKGLNLSAEVGNALSGTVDFKDSYIYEFVISKIADFSVDKSAFDDARFNSTIFSLYLASLNQSDKPTPLGYETFKKTYGVARGGSLYEVIINEYKSTSIDGEADIVGLVKTKTGFFKKTGGGGKKTIFKLFYASPGYIDSARFEEAAKVSAALNGVDRGEVAKVVRDPSADVNAAVNKAAQDTMNSLQHIFHPF